MKGYVVEWCVSDCDDLDSNNYYTLNVNKAKDKFEFWKNNWEKIIEPAAKEFHLNFNRPMEKQNCPTGGNFNDENFFAMSNGIVSYCVQMHIIDIDE